MQTQPRRFPRTGAVLLWVFLGLLGGVGTYASGRQGSRGALGTLPRAGAARISATGRRLSNARQPRVIDPSGFAWVRTTSSAGGGADVAQAVAFGTDGTVVAAGYRADDATEGSHFTVIKYSSGGSAIWSRALGDPNSFSQARDVAVDSANNVIAVGSVAGLFTVAKWDASGNLLWVFPSPQAQVREFGTANSVAVDRNDNIFVGGDVQIQNPNGGFGPDQFAVMAFEPDGSRIWEQLIGFSGAADSVAVDANNDVIAGGTVSGDSPQFFFVTKLANATGKLTWSQVVNGSGGGFNEALSVAVDPQNNVLAAGYVDNNSRDFTVTKLTAATGDFVWLKELDDAANSSDVAYDVASDSAGNAVVSGDLRDDNGNDQFTVFKMAAADGSTVWSRFLQGNGRLTREDDNVAHAVAVDAQDNILAAGWLQNTNGHDFTATKLTSAGGTVWQRSIDGTLNGTDEAYDVAVDPNLNVAVAGMTENTDTFQDFTVAYSDEQPPVLTNCSVNPTVHPPNGGISQLRVTAVDNFEVQTVFARVQNPDASITNVQLSPVSPLSPNGDYTGVFRFLGNITGSPRIYPISFFSTDSAGNQSPLIPCGSVTVNADQQPPVLTNPQANPSQLPQGGGSSTLSVNVTDDVEVSTVDAVVTAGDGSQVTVPLDQNTPGDLTLYSGTLTLPAGPGGTPVGYTHRFIATDTTGNSAAINGPSITVGTDTLAPTISNVQVRPRNLGPDGGPVLVTADVADNVGVGTVTATLTPPSGPPTTVRLQLTTIIPPGARRLPRGIGDGPYGGTLNIPANTGAATQTYRISITATDTSGNSATADGGSVTVAPRVVPPPAVTNLTVSPRNQPFTGGAVTISVDATDDTGISTVVATVTRPAGQTPITVTLARQGNSNTFAGSFNATPNLTQAPQTYAIQVQATNTQGDTTTLDGGTVTVAAPAPIRLQDCEVSPTSLPGSGGNVQVNVDVIAPAGVDRVVVRASPNTKAPSVTADLAPDGPPSGGLVVYTGTLAIPPNPFTTPLTYAITITATDLAGNTATMDCEPVTQSTGGGGTIHVTPANVNFGNVRVGWGLRKKVTIQNTGTGTLSGTISRPFGVFTIVGAEQTITPAKQPHGGTPSIPFVLGKGQKLVVTVQFAPVNHKPQQDTLVISSSDLRNGQKTVKLRGVGCGTPAHGS